MNPARQNQGMAPHVLVAQLGARMHYGVPLLFHRAGMLAHFHTDAYVGQGSVLNFGAKVFSLIPERLRPAVLKRLMGRRENGLPACKVTAFNLFGLHYAWALQKCRSLAEREQVHLTFGRRFSELVRQQGFRDANVIYSFQASSLPLFKKATDLGIYKIMEQFGPAKLVEHEILSEESRLWPDWASPYPDLKVWLPRIELERQEWDSANTIVCGSSFVEQGLTSLGVPREKIAVVPYGLNLSKFAVPRRPWDGRRPLRVLFVGGIALFKGAQYLFKALETLNTKLVTARMVGEFFVHEPYIHLMGKRADLIGKVPRTEVLCHYAWADLFVFPAVCEGSATVNYEALAAGLPVITTPNAGSVVRDGKDGFIVPVRNAEAIAEKIDLMVQDPKLLAWMSQNALQRAQEYSLEKYGERLVKVTLDNRTLC